MRRAATLPFLNVCVAVRVCVCSCVRVCLSERRSERLIKRAILQVVSLSHWGKSLALFAQLPHCFNPFSDYWAQAQLPVHIFTPQRQKERHAQYLTSFFKKFSRFGYCLFKATPRYSLTGQLTHVWTSTANSVRAAALNQFLQAELAARQRWCKSVTWWHSVMSQSHRIKVGATDKAFQEHCLLWEKEATVGADFDLFNLSQE